jgi:hypothetical protein
MPSYLPTEYDDRENWSALQLSIISDMSPDQAMQHMGIKLQKLTTKKITYDDVATMRQLYKNGMSISKISQKFSITPEECEDMMVKQTQYIQEKNKRREEKKKER